MVNDSGERWLSSEYFLHATGLKNFILSVPGVRELHPICQV